MKVERGSTGDKNVDMWKGNEEMTGQGRGTQNEGCKNTLQKTQLVYPHPIKTEQWQYQYRC